METSEVNKSFILNKLIEIKPILYRKYHIKRIGLFGSFSIGNYTDTSDIDLLIEIEKPIGWDFFDLQDFLVEQLNRKIDLVSTKALKPQLKEKILNQTIFV